VTEGSGGRWLAAVPRLRLFLFGQLCTLTGTLAQQVAIAWWLFHLSRSSTLVGIAVALAQLPILALAPIAGVIGDRMDRRRMLIGTQLAGAIQASLVALFAALGRLDVPVVLLFSLVAGLVSAFDTPARQALVPRLVERPQQIRSAVAWNSAVVHVARLLGPALAAVLLSRFTIVSCCLANVASYGVAIVVLRALSGTAHEPIRALSFAALRDGMRYAVRERAVRRVLIVVAATSLVAIPYTVLLPAVARSWAGPQAPIYARLLSSAGLGSLAAAVTLARTDDNRRLAAAIPIAMLVGGAMLVLVGFTGAVVATPVLMATVAGIGFALTLVISGGNVLLQQYVPEQLRARVSSLFVLVFNGAMPVGALILGALADRVGAAGALVVAGSVAGIAAIILAGRRSRSRGR
jgi:MFS family permease